jgi:hypothetical protein
LGGITILFCLPTSTVNNRMAFAESFNSCCVSLPVFCLLSVPRLPSSISQQPGFSNFHFQPWDPSLLFTNMHSCLVNLCRSFAKFDRDCLAHAKSSPTTWNRADGPDHGWLASPGYFRKTSIRRFHFSYRSSILRGNEPHPDQKTRFQSFERVWCCEASQPAFTGLCAGDEEDASERKERTPTTTCKLTSLVEQAI